MTPKWNRVQCWFFYLESCGATPSKQFKGNKGTAFENRDLRAKLCDAIVTMVQATDFWKSNDPADGLYGARFWRISLQRDVKPRAAIQGPITYPQYRIRRGSISAASLV